MLRCLPRAPLKLGLTFTPLLLYAGNGKHPVFDEMIPVQIGGEQHFHIRVRCITFAVLLSPIMTSTGQVDNP